MAHPRERASPWNRMTRRQFLRRSAVASVAFSGAGSFLAACGTSTPSGSSGPGNPTLKLARPDSPVTLPMHDDNPAIASDLEPEAGPLKLYNWEEYVWPRITNRFAKEFGVEVNISTFHNMEEAVAKIATGTSDFDVFFPVIEVVPKFVASKLLRPLNLDYIPNLEKNIWPQLRSPFYDVGSRYTVPYVVYTTGIGYRTDEVSEDPGQRSNPYEILWDPQYSGQVGIYDDVREAMGMTLLKNGIADPNTEKPEHIELAKQDLIAMIDAVNVRTTIDGAYAGLPEHRFGIHQSWSGDMVAAPYYAPEGEDPTVLRYWFPEDGRGMVGNDLIALLTGGKNPVLAHHFLNFMLDDTNAMDNFGWVGYQPPLASIDPDQLVADGWVFDYLRNAIVRPEDFDIGYRLLALSPTGEDLWQTAFSQFKAGV
jgi:spermidine/putrescine transport system substrate-binding protein